MADYGTYYQGIRSTNQDLNSLASLFSPQQIAEREAAKFNLTQQRQTIADQQAAQQAWKQSGGNLGEYQKQVATISPQFAAEYKKTQETEQEKQKNIMLEKAKAAKELDKFIAMGGGSMAAVNSAMQRAKMFGFDDNEIGQVMQVYSQMPDDQSRATHAAASAADYDKWYQQQVELTKASMPKPAPVAHPSQVALWDAQAGAARAKAGGGVDKPKAPSGYRYNLDESLEPIPGGPADVKKQMLDQQKAMATEQAAITSQQVIDQAASLLNHPGRKSATGATYMLGSIPGTDAKGFASQLETFKAQTFVPMVSALKGMGALSDAEGKKLSASVGALDPAMPEAEFEASLRDVVDTLYRKGVAAGLNVVNPVADGGTKESMQQMNNMPPANSAKGRIVRDTSTGIRYQSDGSRWVRVE